MTRLVVAIALFVSLFAVVNTVNAAPPTIDPIDGLISDIVKIDSDHYTATLTIETISSTVSLTQTEVYSPSFDLIDGHVDVYTETHLDDDGTLSQGNRFYIFRGFHAPTTPVMLSISGQTGDPSFDTVWPILKNDCTIIAVIDNGNDPISSTIYTRLGCHMTQAHIDNLPEQLGDSLLQISSLYTVNLPIIAQS